MGWFVTANSEDQFQNDRVPTYPQGLESRAQERHTRHVAIFGRMFRRNLRHHTVRGDHLQNVQALKYCRGQGHPSMLFRVTARDARVARLERNEPVRAIALGALEEMAVAPTLQRDKRLLVDLTFNRTLQVPAEQLCVRVVLMKFCLFYRL